jgi:hypothetical protein
MKETTTAANSTIIEGILEFGIDMVSDPVTILKRHPVFVIFVTLVLLMPTILKRVFPEYKKVNINE